MISDKYKHMVLEINYDIEFIFNSNKKAYIKR
jgi:hypothetical protein